MTLLSKDQTVLCGQCRHYEGVTGKCNFHSIFKTLKGLGRVHILRTEPPTATCEHGEARP